MTHLNMQVRAETRTPDGQVTALPANEALQQFGPRIQVTIGLAQVVAEQLLQQGQTIPAPISGQAMVDTGASVTCIDDHVAQQLSLPAVDIINMASASHPSTEQRVYPVQIEMVGTGIIINTPRAIGVAIAAQGMVALIGRDILQNCTLFYNGPTGSFTLSI